MTWGTWGLIEVTVEEVSKSWSKKVTVVFIKFIKFHQSFTQNIISKTYKSTTIL